MKKAIVLILCALCSIGVMAQKKSVTGVVTDASGESIIRASVMEIGTTNGTFNDSNNTTFTTVSIFIGKNGIEFSTRESNFINTNISTYILFKQKPVLCMSKLFPIKVIA